MITPNGRFTVNQKLCLSMTDFHPESWNPMWSVGTILTGLMSFMSDTQPTSGSINSSTADKKKFAAESLAFNLKSPAFRKLFPDWVEIYNQREQHAEEVKRPSRSSSFSTTLQHCCRGSFALFFVLNYSELASQDISAIHLTFYQPYHSASSTSLPLMQQLTGFPLGLFLLILLHFYQILRGTSLYVQNIHMHTHVVRFKHPNSYHTSTMVLG